MKIRKIKKSELRGFGELMLKEFSEPPFNEVVDIDDVLKSLMFYYKNAKIYIVVEDEIWGGIVFQIEQWWEGRTAVVQDLFVVNKMRNDNINKNLMEFLGEYCCKNDIKKIYFETNKKSSSVKLYEKMGYKINKSRVTMEKKIK